MLSYSTKHHTETQSVKFYWIQIKSYKKNWTKAEEQLKCKTKSIVDVCFSWVGDVYIYATFTIIYWNSPNIDFRSRLPGFSDCSLKSLQKVNDACLYNVPTYKVTITNQRKGRGGIFWMIIYTKIIGLLRSSLFKRVTFQELCKTVLELNKVNRKLPGIVM